MNQKGFATLEVILMIVVIGILASVAVPRFTNMTTKANTAKIQADLTTLDNAISIYFMEQGKYPENIGTDLKNYIQDADAVKPPKGKANLKTGAEYEIPDNATYQIVEDSTTKESRAQLGEHTAGDFGTK